MLCDKNIRSIDFHNGVNPELLNLPPQREKYTPPKQCCREDILELQGNEVNDIHNKLLATHSNGKTCPVLHNKPLYIQSLETMYS